MPAPIVSALIEFINAQVPSVVVWDGEIPRYNTDGTPINPETVIVPPTWPAIKIYMQEGGFERTWTTEDPYSDEGEILVQVWGITRSSVEEMLNTLEALFAQAANWAAISAFLGGPNLNPYYVIQMLLLRWYSGQEEGVRTGLSKLLYRGDLHYSVMLHGAISTT